MNNQTIGVAVIGTGFGQKVHIPGLQAHHKTQVLAVYNPDLEKAKSITLKHNIPHAFNTIEEIISIPEVAAVTISTPPFLHYEMAKKVLSAGKHLLLEKPTTLTVEEAQELYHIAANNKSVATMDFEFRYIPAWQLFAEILADGYVGDKRLIKIDWLASSRANPNRPWNWYAQKDKGGGALGAIASHSFDYINWLFGPTKKLWGQLNTSIKTRPDPTEDNKLKPVDADDTCNIMLDLADGTPCQICISSVTYQGRGHWVEVYGSKGTLIIGSDNQKDYVHGFKVWGSQNGETLVEIKIPDRLEFPQIYPDGRIAPFIRVVDNWVKAIEVGKSVVPSLREGVYSQLLMDLTHESNMTGNWVNVPDLDKLLANSSSF
ncbi:MAG: Gfo/Idh/MocA family oxidoreductase [Okeania sp. SIO2C2]|uniref:Gfo/Idh/MocA family protein n=1 Tax=Okeania sp. SIO2C2 TaxID=2607787 RepID=UPI0013B758D5|nr:Gfo/Idh/MocA family oxidoreductase [Okeania sp. SIO2C2]NEP87795.1 Gfo/Idh/MocA family oxidoreductase [Okeania sp. SIO2C2]